jgi:hypothetical protein
MSNAKEYYKINLNDKKLLQKVKDYSRSSYPNILAVTKFFGMTKVDSNNILNSSEEDKKKYYILEINKFINELNKCKSAKNPDKSCKTSDDIKIGKFKEIFSLITIPDYIDTVIRNNNNNETNNDIYTRPVDLQRENDNSYTVETADLNDNNNKTNNNETNNDIYTEPVYQQLLLDFEREKLKSKNLERDYQQQVIDFEREKLKSKNLERDYQQQVIDLERETQKLNNDIYTKKEELNKLKKINNNLQYENTTHNTENKALKQKIFDCVKIAEEILISLKNKQDGGVNPHLTDFLKHF